MEVVELPNGKLQVLFKGVQIPCRSDIDCPGAGICAINQTWQVTRGQGECMCNTYFGFTGATCQDIGPQLAGFLLINSGVIVVSLIVGFSGIYMLYRAHTLSRIRSLTWEISPVILSLICALIAVAFITVSSATAIPRNLMFRSHYVLVPLGPPGLYNKRPPRGLEIATTLFVSLGYCVSVISITVLPLAFLNVLLVSRKESKVITLMTLGFAFSALLVVLTTTILILTGYSGMTPSRFNLLVGCTWATIWGIVFILNALAFVQLAFLRRTESVQRDPAVGMLLRRMQITSFLLAILTVASFVSTGILPFFESRGYYSDPRSFFDAGELAIRAGRFWVLFSLAACVWFVRGPIMGKRQGGSSKGPSKEGGDHSRKHDGSHPPRACHSSSKQQQQLADRPGQPWMCPPTKVAASTNEEKFDEDHMSNGIENANKENKIILV